MRAAIYIRTWRQDKGHHAYSLRRQEEQAHELAGRHGLTVAYEHVFSDLDYPGDAPPVCWADAGDPNPARPALAALVEAVECGAVQRVIVRKMERLASASSILIGLRDLFIHSGVCIIAPPPREKAGDDPAEDFAVSILSPCIRYDTDEERERKRCQKARHIEEIQRLQERIARLESEIAELNL